MYADDHSPPHFHVRYGDFRAMIDIATGDIIEGNVPRKALRLIQAWVEIHGEELMENWKESQSESPNFSKIRTIKIGGFKMNFVKRVLKAEPYKLTIEFKNGEIKVIDLEDKIRAKSTTIDSKYRAL
jgi:hypothetical protein